MIVATLVVLFAIFFALSRKIILTDFLNLETKDTLAHLDRTHNTLQSMIANLHTKSGDWAVWNDNYEFIQDHNQDFITSNLADQSILNLQINMIAFLNLNAEVVHKKALDLKSAKEVNFPDRLIQYVLDHHLYFGENDLNRDYSGIIMLADKPLMISIRPIVKSDKTGPVRGTLIFGKFLTADVIHELAQMAHLQVHVSPISNSRFASNSESFVAPESPDIITAQKTIQDILKKPILILAIATPRDIYKSGLITIRYLLFALFMIGFFLALVIMLFLEKFLVKRLDLLNREVGSIEREKRFSGRVRVIGKDELSDLSSAINQMLGTLDCTIYETKALNKHLKVTQDQLLQSQKMESIGKLAAGISHDFNNLLGVIIGYVGLLRDEFKDNPKVFKKLGAIQKSAERGALLTRELLGFARKGKYEKTIFNLNDVISETLTILKGTIDKKITLKTRLAADLLNIEGDTTQVMQILMNLVINACDAMPQGGDIIFRTENRDCELPPHLDLEPGTYVHASITDTGCGISEKILSKIFDPFFTTKSVGKGTGLGLSMVYGIMKNHDGAVIADSKEEAGTTMHLYFPKSKAVALEPAAVKKTKQNAILISMVLVAEDEAFLREFYQDYFSKYFPATKIILAVDGEEALSLFQQHREELDLLLLDVVMPKMGGIEAYEEMKKIKPDIKTIFISGYSESNAILNLRKNGDVGFIQKPLESEKFIAAIENMIT